LPVSEDGPWVGREAPLLSQRDQLLEAFGSAEEFLESTRIEDTACLITDVQMPGLNGVELQDRLISDGHDMPTIFVSAFPDTRLERRVLESGAIAYLRKPFEMNHLLDVVFRCERRRKNGPGVGIKAGQ